MILLLQMRSFCLHPFFCCLKLLIIIYNHLHTNLSITIINIHATPSGSVAILSALLHTCHPFGMKPHFEACFCCLWICLLAAYKFGFRNMLLICAFTPLSGLSNQKDATILELASCFYSKLNIPEFRQIIGYQLLLNNLYLRTC